MQSSPDDPAGPTDTRWRVASSRSLKKAHGLLGLGEKASRNKLTKPRMKVTLEAEDSSVRIPSRSYESADSMTGLGGQHELYHNHNGGQGQIPVAAEGFSTRRNDLPPTPSTPRSPTINGGGREDRYPSPRLPWSPSQQTFTPSTRDTSSMHSLPISYGNSTESILKGTKGKTKKSALTQSKSVMDIQQSSDDTSTRQRSKRLDMSRLFASSRESPSRLSPSRFGNAPTEIADAPELFTSHTTHVELKRRTGTGRLEVIATDVRSPSIESSSTTTVRAKVFEKEIFEPSKRTVKRPPKGIQHWFDAIDVSSEDDGQDEDEQLGTDTVKAVGHDPTQKAENHLSELLQRSSPTQSSNPALKEARVPIAELEQTSSPKPNPVSPNHANTAATRAIPDRLAVSISPRVASPTPASSNVAKHKQQHKENPLAQRGFASSSVLSLTDSDSDAPEYTKTASASAMTFQRPPIPPRKVHNPPSPARQKPVLEEEEEEEPILPPVPARPSRSSHEKKPSTSYSSGDRIMNYSDHVKNARRSSQSSSRRKYAHRRLTGSSTQTRFEDSRSPTTSTAIDSSVPSATSPDADRIMAVTEEEMMLLELMRQRKVNMQKNFSPEGYSNSVSEALMQLKMGRDSAQLLGAEILKRKEIAVAGGGGKRGSRRGSAASSSVSGPVAFPEEGRRGSRVSLIDRQDLSYEQLRDLTAIRKEDAENAKRIERFLRQQSPVDDQYPTSLPESALARGASTRTRDSGFSSSQLEEALAQTGLKMSPMQRLTRRLTDTSPVRDSYSTTFEEQQEVDEPKLRGYLDAQKIVEARKLERLFGLNGERKHSLNPTVDSDADVETNDEDDTDSAGNADSAAEEPPFPQPPPNRMSFTVEDRLKRGGRMSLLDSPVLEEEPVPDTRIPDSDSSEAVTATRQGSAAPSSRGIPGRSSNARQMIAAMNGLPSNRPASTPPTWKKTKTIRVAPDFEQNSWLLSSPAQGSLSSSPSVSTTRPAPPLTPQSIIAKPHEESAVPGAEEKLDGNVRHHNASEAKMSDTKKRQMPSTPTPAEQPPAATDMSPSSSIDTWRDKGRVTSMSSITSASGDVMAAWAELGGGNDAYSARRQYGSRLGNNSTRRGH